MLLPSIPPIAVLDGLGYATAVCAALLLVGMWTRFATFGLAVSLMMSIGLLNSLGALNHPYLMFWVPVVMLFSDWGRDLSVQRSTPVDEPVAQWPLRLLALVIGLSFMTSGYAKLRAGWLDPHTHATQGYLLQNYVLMGRHEWLTPEFIGITSGVFWEAIDWMTVILETGLLFAVLSWPLFRFAIALMTQFHLGILLILNIAFAPNVLAYGAFVSWHRVAPSFGRRVRWNAKVAAVVAVALGIGSYQSAIHGMEPALITEPAIVLIGGAIGVGYLIFVATRLVASWLRARSEEAVRSR
jgi:hypothetical protein